MRRSRREAEFYNRLDNMCLSYLSTSGLNSVKYEYDNGSVSDSLFPCIYEFAAGGETRAELTNRLFGELDGWILTVANSAETSYQKKLLANNLLCETVFCDYDLMNGQNGSLGQTLYSTVMMNALGVDTSAALSQTHVWNVIRLDDGNCYAVDACWDDTDESSPAYDNRYLNLGETDLRQHRIMRQERIARHYASEQGAKMQEYFAYCKFLQRGSGAKCPQDAAERIVRCCP